jgi:aspartyl-tRNA(Asn)/glutamyl-tRNA(Gln) amidotransferase subunit A
LERVSRVISDFGDGVSDRPVAILKALGGIDCEPAVLNGLEAAISALGATVEITPPYPPSRIRFAGFISASQFLAAHLADADPAKISPSLSKLLTYGPKRSEADLADDQRVISETKAALEDAIDTYGAILMPSAPQAAFPHSNAVPANQADFTCLANIAGLPAISIPAGWDSEGLPVGVQLVGKIGHEAGLFALARKLDATLAAFCTPANFGY